MFHGKFEKALKKAKAENKIVFVDFFTTWWGPCKFMAKNVFSQKEVGDFFNKNFISFKVQCDKDKVGEKIADKYGVKAFPTLIWVKPDGSVIHKTMGSKSKEMLLLEAKKALKKNKKSASKEVKKTKPVASGGGWGAPVGWGGH